MRPAHVDHTHRHGGRHRLAAGAATMALTQAGQGVSYDPTATPAVVVWPGKMKPQA